MRTITACAILAICALGVPTITMAQGAAVTSQAPASQPRPGLVRVVLQTSEGPIVLELEKDRAPLTTRNFLRYVDEKRYDGQTIYRAVNIAENFGLIQGGETVLKPGQRQLPPIAHEPTTLTGLSHQTGTISMGRLAPGTARSDFFITVGDMSSLDAHPDKPGDNLGFSAFGHVVEGMDVVLKIMRLPINPALGAKQGMVGQMLAQPVKIMIARRVAAPVNPAAKP